LVMGDSPDSSIYAPPSSWSASFLFSVFTR
jgi:hypothetical protein